VKTSINVNQVIPFRVLKGVGGRQELRATFNQPSQPGVSPGTFTIQNVTLSVKGSSSSHGSFITNPPACAGSWSYALKIVNYFGQPSITAHDRVKCRA
jgi:hypothetical protein